MNERTTSILQRAPVILAVTAASYGLPIASRGPRMRTAAEGHRAARESKGAAERRHKNGNRR